MVETIRRELDTVQNPKVQMTFNCHYKGVWEDDIGTGREPGTSNRLHNNLQVTLFHRQIALGEAVRLHCSTVQL